MIKRALLLILIFLAGVFAENCRPGGQAKEAQQKGRIQAESGITIVNNPLTPLYPRDFIRFEPELAVGSKPSSAESVLGSISSFTVDDQGNIFAFDIKSVCLKVFDSQGHFLRSIGQKGQGPGEFQAPENIQWTRRGELMVSDGLKRALMFFSGDGRLLKEIKIAGGMLGSYLTYSGDNGDLYASRLLSFHDQSVALDKLTSDYKIIKNLATYQLGKAGVNPTYPPPQLRYAILPGNRIAWGITPKYEVCVADSQGNIVKRIARAHTPRRIPEAYKTRILELTPAQFRRGTRFGDLFPAFDLLCADDQGRLFIKTFEQKDETGRWLVDVFDTDGRYLAQAALAFPDETSTSQEGKWAIKAGKAYVKDFDNEGYPVIRRYRIVEGSAVGGEQRTAEKSNDTGR